MFSLALGRHARNYRCDITHRLNPLASPAHPVKAALSPLMSSSTLAPHMSCFSGKEPILAVIAL